MMCTCSDRLLFETFGYDGSIAIPEQGEGAIPGLLWVLYGFTWIAHYYSALHLMNRNKYKLTRVHDLQNMCSYSYPKAK